MPLLKLISTQPLIFPQGYYKSKEDFKEGPCDLQWASVALEKDITFY